MAQQTEPAPASSPVPDAPAAPAEPVQAPATEAPAPARARSPLHVETGAAPVEPGGPPRMMRLAPRLPTVEPLLRLAARPAADVGEIPAELLARCRAWQRLPVAQRDAQTVADADAFVDAWARARMVPGDYGGKAVESIAPGDLVPCGQADGVVYLGEVQGPATAASGNVPQVIAPSLQRYAIRYVRKPDLVLQAVMGALTGLVSHEFPDLCRKCPGIRAIAQDVEAERQARYGGNVHVYFSLWHRGVDAVQPAHAPRWIARQAEAGVWCLFYV